MLKGEKTSIIQNYAESANDTGSSKVQIALFTKRINELTEHFKVHKKDYHSKTGLFKLINRRKRLLKYVKKCDPKGYSEFIEKLGIRK